MAALVPATPAGAAAAALQRVASSDPAQLHATLLSLQQALAGSSGDELAGSSWRARRRCALRAAALRR